MLTQIANFIGYNYGSNADADLFIVGTGCLCVVLCVFYLFDTMHDLVMRIGKK